MPPEARSNGGSGSQALRVSLQRNSHDRKRHQMQLRAETERMSYTGVSAGRSRGAAASEAHSVGDLLIGVYRKGENTVKLVRIDKVRTPRPPSLLSRRCPPPRPPSSDDHSLE